MKLKLKQESVQRKRKKILVLLRKMEGKTLFRIQERKPSSLRTNLQSRFKLTNQLCLTLIRHQTWHFRNKIAIFWINCLITRVQTQKLVCSLVLKKVSEVLIMKIRVHQLIRKTKNHQLSRKLRNKAH